MLTHWSMAPWDPVRWPNFTPHELACRCCGELWYDPVAFDTLQRARNILGAPLRVYSAHRCILHNARVGGAPASEHKRVAFDLGLAGHTPEALYGAVRQAGFTTFGFYGTFIHTDLRPGRRWSTAAGRRVWTGVIS